MPVDKRAIEGLLAAKGARKKALAKKLGVTGPAVSQILAGNRQVTASEIPKFAEFLGVTNDRVLTLLGVDSSEERHMIIVKGVVSEDTVQLFSPDGRIGGDLEPVESPFPSYEGTVVRVRGNEMFPRYRDGDLIAFNQNGASADSLLGRDAIVETEDGTLLLKVIQLGSEPGRYVLLSNNPAIPPLVNVQIKSVAAIDWHKP